MKVSDILIKIEHLRNLRQDVFQIANIGKNKSLDTDCVNTLEDAVDAIDAYIDELMRKEVKL